MDPTVFIHALNDAGVTHVIGVPDTETGPVFETLRSSGPPRLVPVCREGEAYAIAAGLWAGGARPVVLIQSTGFFEAGDALRSIAFELEAPLEIIIGYRGYSGKLNAGAPDTARKFLEPLLKAWDIPYEVQGSDEDYSGLSRALASGASRDIGARAFLLPQ